MCSLVIICGNGRAKQCYSPASQERVAHPEHCRRINPNDISLPTPTPPSSFDVLVRAAVHSASQNNSLVEPPPYRVPSESTNAMSDAVANAVAQTAENDAVTRQRILLGEYGDDLPPLPPLPPTPPQSPTPPRIAPPGHACGSEGFVCDDAMCKDCLEEIDAYNKEREQHGLQRVGRPLPSGMAWTRIEAME